MNTQISTKAPSPTQPPPPVSEVSNSTTQEATGRPICALSIDLDPLTAYYTIHGLGGAPHQIRHTIMRKALPRFEALFQEAEIAATFFVVAQEVENESDIQKALPRLVENGHEIANHTYSHPYHLCQMSTDEIGREIGRAHDVISSLVNKEAAPVGFRSPGYFANAKTMTVLSDRGYHYDSSMFPSPPYYFAKAVAMGGMALRGHRSGAILADPRSLITPTEPYHPNLRKPWRRGDSSLVELPIAVTPYSRVPAIGTLLTIAPSPVRRLLIRQMAKRSFFNLELHGIDLLDAVDDRIPTELTGRQPDLRVSVDEKRSRLLATLRNLARTHDFLTLKDAAARYR